MFFNREKRDRILIKVKIPYLPVLVGNGAYYAFKPDTDLSRINDRKYIRKQFGSWKKHIKKYKQIILGENWYCWELSKYIKEQNPKCKVIVFFWNKLLLQPYFDILKDPNVDEFYIFDEEEAKKYNLKWNSTFYSKRMSIEKNKIKNDIVFIGRAKDREKQIKDLEKELKKQKIKTDFKIITDEKDIIEYSDYLEMVSKSRAILDYNAYNQSGLSLRVMESLFLKKKLITSNKNIKKCDFYNKNNIFILGEDKLSDLYKFIHSDYQEIDEKILDYYDFDNWIQRFE